MRLSDVWWPHSTQVDPLGFAGFPRRFGFILAPWEPYRSCRMAADPITLTNVTCKHPFHQMRPATSAYGAISCSKPKIHWSSFPTFKLHQIAISEVPPIETNPDKPILASFPSIHHAPCRHWQSSSLLSMSVPLSLKHPTLNCSQLLGAKRTCQAAPLCPEEISWQRPEPSEITERDGHMGYLLRLWWFWIGKYLKKNTSFCRTNLHQNEPPADMKHGHLPHPEFMELWSCSLKTIGTVSNRGWYFRPACVPWRNATWGIPWNSAAVWELSCSGQDFWCRFGNESTRFVKVNDCGSRLYVT